MPYFPQNPKHQPLFLAGGSRGLNPQIPVGVIDGANTVFTITGNLGALFLNGAFQTPAGVDYVLTGGTIINYVIAPPEGSTHYII